MRADSSASVQVAMNVPLDEIRTALEVAIPPKIERLGATEFDGGWGVRYGAWRGPISVSGQGGTLRIGARIEFAVWVCKKISRLFGGSFCQPVASCGYGGDPLAAVDVWADVTGSWTPDWSVAASVNTGTATLRPCRMTMFNIDVTQRAVGLLRAKIEAEAGKVRERLQLRPLAERAWGRITPLSLGSDAWITWRAAAVRVGPIVFQPWAVTSDAAIDLDASVVTSATPPTIPALPSSLTLGAIAASSPPSWQLHLALAWSDIGSALKSQFGTYDATDAIHVGLVRVSAAGDRVQLDLDVSGAISGAITASGAISYDAATDVLAITDIKLAGVAPDLAAQIALAALTTALETRLKGSFGALAASSLTGIDQQLTARGLAHPALTGLHPDVVVVTPSHLVARMSVPGALVISP